MVKIVGAQRLAAAWQPACARCPITIDAINTKCIRPRSKVQTGHARKTLFYFGAIIRRSKNVISVDEKVDDYNLLLSSAHSLQEGFEGHESFIILGFAQLLHQGLGLLLGQLLAEVGQQKEQLMSKHGVVVVFVVQLQDLNKVVESTLVLGLLGGLVHGEALILAQHLLSLLGLTSDLSNGLEGGVQVAGSHQIASIEGEVDCLDFLFLKTKLSHD